MRQATQVASGQDSNGNTAIAHGSLPLTAASNGYYTVRNLTQSTAYTVCLSDGGSVPVSANLTANAETNLANANWGYVGSPAGFSVGAAWSPSLAFAPDGSPYVVYADCVPKDDF